MSILNKEKHAVTYASRRHRLQTRAHRHSVDFDMHENTASNNSSGSILQASAITLDYDYYV